MNYEEVENLAFASGFSHIGKLDAATIEVRKEVRDACAENKCHAYGTNWSCPPAWGDLHECEGIIRKYKYGLILQTTGNIQALKVGAKNLLPSQWSYVVYLYNY